jgi:hypothetical protein
MEKLSGSAWTSQFKGSTSIFDLSYLFFLSTHAFIKSLWNAGAVVKVNATLRPPERAYLMHWSWKIARGLISPEDVPSMPGVNIQWVHRKVDGKVDHLQSIQAAKDMVVAYEISALNVAPALNSRHTEGRAIDMNITWDGTLAIEDKEGKTIRISTFPRDGMNPALHEVGKSYSVIKYHGGAKDKPHWSNDGH